MVNYCFIGPYGCVNGHFISILTFCGYLSTISCEFMLIRNVTCVKYLSQVNIKKMVNESWHLAYIRYVSVYLSLCFLVT